MTGSLRPLALLTCLSAPVLASTLPCSLAGESSAGPSLSPAGSSARLTASSLALDEIADELAAGVEALQRGKPDEAKPHFQRVLALDPSVEVAYELWKNTDSQVWLDMIASGDAELELLATRLMSRARSGRVVRSRDEDAIKEQLAGILSDDPIERRRAVQELAVEHGEFAVPYMLPALADPTGDDRRVLTMQALTEMTEEVVLPLVEALRTSDEYLRRNVALTLGYIGDPRANGALSWLAQSDPDTTVRSAAAQALERTGGSGNAEEELLALGDAYLAHHHTVVNHYLWSEVVWRWEGGALVASDVPRAIYAEELAKGAFYDALVADPSSTRALAGLIRAYQRQLIELEEWAARGSDVEDLLVQASEGVLATEAAGIDTLDRALSEAVGSRDNITAVGLCRVLAHSASAPTPGLWSALSSGDGALRAEAALALGSIAVLNGEAAHPDVVMGLGEAAGREIVRIAAAVGGSTAHVADALAAEGLLVNRWGKATLGLAGLRRAPGVDVIVLAGDISDLTLDQVLSDLLRDPKYADTPVVIATDDDELEDMYDDRIRGVVPTDASDLAAIDAALSGALDGDRAEADRIAASAAVLLADLAVAGSTDVGPALGGLRGTLAARSDAVVLPALMAIGAQGGTGQLGEVLAVATDKERSDEARQAACSAAASILGRDNAVGGEVLQTLTAVMRSDAALSVRQTAARALGKLDLAPEIRANVLRAVRVRLGE